ncbi:ABC transporter permease [Candidatus Bathyarchaeota archaeon]|nr:ABC transporter permease [Candidatus Bathyarchaeota archaeon]
MKITAYIAKRLFYSIFVLLGLSMFIFTLSRVVPGDPARLALGPLAPQWAVDQLREKLHLNDPLPVQYVIWLMNALRGDLGESIVSKRPVSQDVLTFFPASFELVMFSTIISVPLAILVGALAGRRANSIFDNIVRVFSYVGIAVPTFVWAVLALFLFGYLWKVLPIMGQLSVGIRRPPVRTGMMSIDALLAGRWDAFVDHLKHMILPALCMSVGRIAQEARLLRAGIIENLKKDYIVAAISYGIPERRVMMTYLLKPSLIPMVSIMALDLASSMGGSFIIETIFNWPGFGRYGMWAMLNKDLNAVVASVMIVGIFFALFNILVDVIIAYLDPRIRVMERAS